jgi:AcrR family transcriptional regulator
VKENKEIWIKVGYEIFAIKGHNSLKVEVLANKVGKNKSSFYHHFADLELFTEELLKYHIHRSYVIAEQEKQAKTIDPELIDIIVENKVDVLFNRQLRINSNVKNFYATLKKSDEIIGNAFILLWIRDLELKLNYSQLESIFTLALENFYLQVNLDNLRFEWLKLYFDNLKHTVKNIAQSN